MSDFPAPVLLRVRLTPRASKDSIVDYGPDRVLHVRVKAPPVDGKANQALCKFLKKSLGIRGPAPVIVKGASTKGKTLELRGIDAQALQERLVQFRQGQYRHQPDTNFSQKLRR